MTPSDLSRVSLLDLFRREVDSQAQVLTSSLLAAERLEAVGGQLEAGMRAAHSLKGAARIVNLAAGVRIAGGIEEGFVAAQQGRVVLGGSHIDRLLAAVDLLRRIAATADADLADWDGRNAVEIDACVAELEGILEATEAPPPAVGTAIERAAAHPLSERERERDAERVLRVTAESLNRLLGLAGESLVESRWIEPFANSLLRLKRLQQEAAKAVRQLRDTIPVDDLEHSRGQLAAAERALADCQELVSTRLVEIEMFDRRSSNLSRRLYDEALACRMRPFSDGVRDFPRIARDLARSLGKQARLDLAGEATQVDRDILQKLEAPLGHLLRNAVDHGIESPEERRSAGKPVEGAIRLEARHSAGMLQVIVSDDGRGVDPAQVRDVIVRQKLVAPDAARSMSEAELFEFLFLPGFTMKETVTDVSGRGVGLDVVQNMVKEVRGVVRVTSQFGKGTKFQLQLPVTLSVVRALLVEIGGEPYAFPLTSISRAVIVPTRNVELVEGRQHFELDGRSVGLVAAHQILGVGAAGPSGDEVSVIVAGDAAHIYGLVVDRFLGERELVVQPFGPHLGKIKDIAAGAVMEDGTPVLIIDTDDLIRSVEKLCAESQLTGVGTADPVEERRRKRVLVVDDSMTVRELERKLLGNLGYEVEVAVDGMDAWNALRTGRFNLVVTDVDMPRMDGIELVARINKDPNLKSVPVMIVSYKDRDEDRRRGLEAGAAHYLTKGSFHDETLAQAVVDLIGEAER